MERIACSCRGYSVSPETGQYVSASYYGSYTTFHIHSGPSQFIKSSLHPGNPAHEKLCLNLAVGVNSLWTRRQRPLDDPSMSFLLLGTLSLFCSPCPQSNFPDSPCLPSQSGKKPTLQVTVDQASLSRH